MAILKVANIHFDTAGTTLIRVNGANTLTFNTAGAEDMRIDPAGNVLIGRTNSTVGNNVKLDVAGGINASAVLVNGAPALTGNITSNVVISVADNNNAALRITQTGTGDAIRVEDDANTDSTPFVVDANGNVGIGTSLPSYKLLVRTPVLGADGVAAAGPVGFTALLPSTAGGNFNPLVSANDQSIIFYGGSSGAGSGTGNLIIAPWSTSSVGMKIDYNGNVLIGRTNSTVGNNVKLDVNGAINASAVLVNGQSIIAIFDGANTITNAAFTQANTARTQANTAFLGANAALIQANTARDQGNTAFLGANAALIQANTARDQANVAYTQANTALIQANTARNQANDAYTQANSAFLRANSTTYTSNVVISVADNTNAALRITQTGTAPAIRVEDSTNPDSTPFIVDANGNIGIAGNVGIGTGISGDVPLTYSAKVFIIGQTGASALTLYNSDGTNANVIQLNGTGLTSSIATSNTDMLFNTDYTNQRMRIQTSGNVLIGRTNSTVGQGVLLDVNGAINASAVLVNGAPLQTTTLTSNVVIAVADNSNAALRITQTGTGDALRVEDSANPDSTPFIIDATGKVGIGTTSLDESFQVAGAISTSGVTLANKTSAATFDFATGFNSARILAWGSAGSTANISFWSGSGGGGATERLRIDNSGNVLIGRTDSTVGLGVKLDVNGAINASAIYVNGAAQQSGAATYSANVGNNSANTFNVSHSLNKQFVIPAVRENSTGYYVYPDIKYTSVNTIVLEFVNAPTTNQYTVIVLG